MLRGKEILVLSLGMNTEFALDNNSGQLYRENCNNNILDPKSYFNFAVFPAGVLSSEDSFKLILTDNAQKLLL